MERLAKDIADELRGIDLFTALDSRQLRLVVDSTRVVRLDDGERLFDHGQTAAALLPSELGPAQALSQLAERR